MKKLSEASFYVIREQLVFNWQVYDVQVRTPGRPIRDRQRSTVCVLHTVLLLLRWQVRLESHAEN